VLMAIFSKNFISPLGATQLCAEFCTNSTNL
jgi:hypothetical protein